MFSSTSPAMKMRRPRFDPDGPADGFGRRDTSRTKDAKKQDRQRQEQRRQKRDWN